MQKNEANQDIQFLHENKIINKDKYEQSTLIEQSFLDFLSLLKLFMTVLFSIGLGTFLIYLFGSVPYFIFSLKFILELWGLIIRLILYLFSVKIRTVNRGK